MLEKIESVVEKMKRKWIETGQDLLTILLNHLVIIAFGVAVMGMMEQDNNKLWLWTLLLVIPLLFYWAKRKNYNLLLFYALHAIVPIVVILLPVHIITKFLMLLFSIVYVVWSIKVGIIVQGRGDGVIGPVAMTPILGIMLLIEVFSSQKGWEGIYIAIAILYAAGYCIHLFVSRYLDFMTVNESSAANIPETEIFKQGFCFSSMYVTGVVAFLVLLANVQWFHGIDSWIVSRIGSVFRKFFKTAFISERAEKQKLQMAMSAEQEAPDVEMLLEKGEATISRLNLEEPIIIGGILILAALAVFGIVKGIRYLWKGFRKTPESEGIKDGIDIRETCTIEKTKKEESNWFAFLNNREKIRKLYRKRVLKNKVAIIGDMAIKNLEYMTAKECCDIFSAAQLKKGYEKARYSAEEITSDDVRTAKKSGR